MQIVDVNVLLYAVNRASPFHARANAWLDDAMSGDETLGIPWVVLLGFIRISTNARAFEKTLTAAEAIRLVDSWLERPNVVPLGPGDDHWPALRSLLTAVGAAGNLTTDAHLAALAMEYDAELCSTDTDFARFAKLRWTNPCAV